MLQGYVGVLLECGFGSFVFSSYMCFFLHKGQSTWRSPSPKGRLIQGLHKPIHAVYMPNQRFNAAGNEIAYLMEGLHVLAHLLPDSAAIETVFLNAALRYQHLPLGSADTNPDAFATNRGQSPSCDNMLRGGLIRMARGPTVGSYLQDLWEVSELRNSATVTMGKVQKLSSDAAFHATATMIQIGTIFQTSMIHTALILSKRDLFFFQGDILRKPC